MSFLQTERRGAATWLRISRPEKRNALTVEMYEELIVELKSARLDDEVRVVVLTGSGGTFTAGNDLSDFLARPPTGPDSPVLRFLAELVDFDKPLVAAVDGVAVGIGTTLLLHCDLVVATERARFQLPFVKLGLVPEGASSLLLPALVGQKRAAEWLMLGDPIDAATALSAGLVNRVVPVAELEAQTTALVETLCARPKGALARTKELLGFPHRDQIKSTLAREAAVFAERLASDEARGAFAAFLGKK